MSKSRKNASLKPSDNDKDEPKKKKTKTGSQLIPKAGSVSKKQGLEYVSSKFVGKNALLNA